jgi:hypothetical protein
MIHDTSFPVYCLSVRRQPVLQPNMLVATDHRRRKPQVHGTPAEISTPSTARQNRDVASNVAAELRTPQTIADVHDEAHAERLLDQLKSRCMVGHLLQWGIHATRSTPQSWSMLRALLAHMLHGQQHTQQCASCTAAPTHPRNDKLQDTRALATAQHGDKAARLYPSCHHPRTGRGKSCKHTALGCARQLKIGRQVVCQT